MEINVKIISHHEHRYETVGDWWFDKQGNLEVRVSRMENTKYENLVAIHEITEALLCKYRVIEEKDVSKFDIEYEKKRKLGLVPPDSEPGDDKDAPYRKEHFFATSIERLIAAEFQVDWSKYDTVIAFL